MLRLWRKVLRAARSEGVTLTLRESSEWRLSSRSALNGANQAVTTRRRASTEVRRLPTAFCCVYGTVGTSLRDFSCRTQLAPLLGQRGLAQSGRMVPLLKVLVLVHAACRYRPVSSAGLPTERESPTLAMRISCCY